MKKLLLITLIITTGISKALNLPNRKYPDFCLEMSGRIYCLNGQTNRYKVELIEKNQVVDSVFIFKGGAFSFLVKNNTRYTVRIIKNGYDVKTVKIHTSSPLKDYEKSRLDFITGIETDSDLPQSIVSFKSSIRNTGARDYAGHFSKLLLASN